MSFVEPRSERIPLSDGEWIDVKRELTAGENRRMFARQIKGYSETSGKAIYDAEQVGFARIVAYLLRWSLTANGKPVPVSEDAIDGLTQARYREISEAIDRHEERVERERMAEKNGRDGKIAPVAISPSAA